MASLIRVIRMLKEQIKSLDKAIEDHLAKHWIPFLVLVRFMRPPILAEIGDIHQFQTHGQLVMFAALVWTENQSGDFTAVQTRLIHSGNRYP